MVSPVYRETQQAIERVFEKQIFFVVGVMKSGTTWLQFLLNHHPEVCCKGEGHFTDLLYLRLHKAIGGYSRHSATRNKMFERSGIKGNFPHFSAADMRYLLATAIGLIFVRWAGGSTVKCVGDKTPIHIEGIDLLDAVIPGAKYVHIIRDGRDAAVATWFGDIHRDRQEILKDFKSFNIFAEDFAKKWAGRIKRAQDFGAANPDRYFELRYEDLHREPAPIVRGLFAFLGVDAGDQVVSECIEAASFERLTDGRTRGEEKAGAHMRKGVVGDWRNHFDEADRATFNEHAGDLLKQMGYDD